MTQITPRAGSGDGKKNKKDGKKTGKSLNRVVLDLINKTTGSVKKPSADSLRKLAGGWGEADAAEFIQSIKSCEQIDEKIWE